MRSIISWNKESQINAQKTSFSNISKISTGNLHSLFQNDKGEIFSCGYNEFGQCGLGHFDSPQITPSVILNVPENIVHFVCGASQSFLIQKEIYFLLGIMRMTAIRMY